MNRFINLSERIYEKNGTECFAILILGEDEKSALTPLVESVIRQGYIRIW